MFKGQFIYSLDSKGRISIPAKLRRHISAEANDTIVITRGTDGCIDLYPLDQWQLFEEKLLKLNPFNSKDAMFIRMILQHAIEDKLDSQSRINLPQNLIQYAKIEKDVFVIGALKKIELWNPKRYNEYLKNAPNSYEEIAEHVMNSSL